MPQALPHRQLKAQMILKGLSLRTVSQLSGVEYVRCSEILNGRRIDPARLSKIAAKINAAPMPEEVAS